MFPSRCAFKKSPFPRSPNVVLLSKSRGVAIRQSRDTSPPHISDDNTRARVCVGVTHPHIAHKIQSHIQKYSCSRQNSLVLLPVSNYVPCGANRRRNISILFNSRTRCDRCFFPYECIRYFSNCSNCELWLLK